MMDIDPRRTYSIADLLPRRTEAEWHQFFDEAERSRARVRRAILCFIVFAIAFIITSYVIR